MQAFINYIGTAVPDFKFPQLQIADFMGNALGMGDEEKRKLEILYRATGISYRHSVLSDYGKQPENFSFYPKTALLNPFPDISSRMRVYEHEAASLGVAAIRNALPPDLDLQEISHLVTVSCTGMYAPGLDLDLVKQLGLKTTVERTAINFMGCYGAFNGMKVASYICRSNPEAKVLLLAVELCTLHFRNEKDQDTLLANALFSDGAAAALISGKNLPGSLEMLEFHTDIAADSEREMAWQIGNHGFEMQLTSLVPEIIEKNIAHLTDTLLEKMKISLADIELFAIHPGGKKILEVIERSLNISRKKNSYAHEVLRSYGNMSSPTILFVLKKLLEDGCNQKHALSFAFGPGLTLESMLLYKS